MTIPHRCQRNALAVGVLNAIAMRVQLIIAVVSLLEIFNWMIYVFDAFLIFLIFTAIRMFVHKKEEKIVVQKTLPCRP
jgi:predicted tellurium resistance membrane protein TerC